MSRNAVSIAFGAIAVLALSTAASADDARKLVKDGNVSGAALAQRASSNGIIGTGVVKSDGIIGTGATKANGIIGTGVVKSAGIIGTGATN